MSYFAPEVIIPVPFSYNFGQNFGHCMPDARSVIVFTRLNRLARAGEYSGLYSGFFLLCKLTASLLSYDHNEQPSAQTNHKKPHLVMVAAESCVF